MDDFRLKVFIAAARTLSFTRAAEQLYISQPAVSKHVGELESRYKVQLFTRRGSRLELTDAGRTMLEAAGRLLDDYRRLEYEMSLCADQTGGELRLGASTTIAQYLLPPILAHFTARFPGVRVSMSSGNSAEVEQALGEHAVARHAPRVGKLPLQKRRQLILHPVARCQIPLHHGSFTRSPTAILFGFLICRFTFSSAASVTLCARAIPQSVSPRFTV